MVGHRVYLVTIMKKNLVVNLIVVVAALAPLSALGQEADTPEAGRLELGGAKGDGTLKPAGGGAVSAGDLGVTLPGLEEKQEEEKKKRGGQRLGLDEKPPQLSDSEWMEVNGLLQEAAGFIQGIRLTEGLDRLIRIEQMAPRLHQAHNLRGVIFTKLEDYETARAAFRKALEIKDGSLARFNLAELDFAEKKSALAEAAFSKLKADFPDLRESTVKLIDYKLFISALLQSESPGDEKEKAALAALETFDPFDTSPVYYYSHAALAFHKGDEEDAREWIASAGRIYDKPTAAVYLDALHEMGWLDSL